MKSMDNLNGVKTNDPSTIKYSNSTKTIKVTNIYKIGLGTLERQFYKVRCFEVPYDPRFQEYFG